MTHTIYIHGLGQSASAWDNVISSMKKESIALCPDLAELFHGKEHTYASLYTGFCAYCEELPEPFKLCGLSLGAVLALNYVIDHPQKVSALVLIGAQYRMPKMLMKLQHMIFKFVRESSFPQVGFGKKDFMQLTDSMAALDFGKDLKLIPCHTLVLCGEKDKANKKAAQEIASLLVHAKYQTVQEAGHEVNMDAPEKLASILDSYYERSDL